MRLTTLLACIVLMSSSCVITGKLGLSPNRISGEEVKSKIKKAYYMTVILRGSIPNGSTVYYVEKGGLVSNIKPKEMYYKPEVDKCISSMYKHALLNRVNIYLSNYDCDLFPDKTILDKPFPEL